ncbi:hypothetical protein [Syntrophomonas palmitatica]|uniref:hypothetical protein n=1 Tax=Syntrophomonas palmitatica TaxID=402877 RepID=UPI0006D281E9|nr:hypothetical protein [Syntrophomonas palmitatica]
MNQKRRLGKDPFAKLNQPAEDILEKSSANDQVKKAPNSTRKSRKTSLQMNPVLSEEAPSLPVTAENHTPTSDIDVETIKIEVKILKQKTDQLNLLIQPWRIWFPFLFW